MGERYITGAEWIKAREQMLAASATPRYRRRRCEDCDGTGEERIPCGPGDTRCEFCGGLGYFDVREADHG